MPIKLEIGRNLVSRINTELGKKKAEIYSSRYGNFREGFSIIFQLPIVPNLVSAASSAC
jgi:hypothetical protein